MSDECKVTIESKVLYLLFKTFPCIISIKRKPHEEKIYDLDVSTGNTISANVFVFAVRGMIELPKYISTIAYLNNVDSGTLELQNDSLVLISSSQKIYCIYTQEFNKNE